MEEETVRWQTQGQWRALLSVSTIVSWFSTGKLNTERINVRRGLDDMIWVGQE